MSFDDMALVNYSEVAERFAFFIAKVGSVTAVQPDSSS